MSAVRVRGVTASYTPGVPVLHAVDLDVFAGSTTAVLGASGCGKTTLLRIIAGFVRPDAGEVEIGDRVRVDFRRIDDDLTLPIWRREEQQ